MAYRHINTVNTFPVQSGATRLQRIVVNQTGDPDWLVTVYNGPVANNDVVAVLDANNGGNYDYDALLPDGLYIVTQFTGSGTNNGDITVMFG